MTLTQQITLDIYDPPYFEYVNAKQADNVSRILIVTLTAHGEAIKPSAGTDTAVFRALKPDRTSVIDPAAIGQDGKITVALTDQVLACPGKVEADVSILKGDEVLSSATFYIQVDKAPISGAQIASSDEFLVMVQATSEAEAAAGEAREAAGKADTAAGGAAAAAGRANDAAKLLEGMTVTAEKVPAGGNPTAALTKQGDHYKLDLGLVTGDTGPVSSVNGQTGDVVIGGRNLLTGTKDFSGKWENIFTETLWDFNETYMGLTVAHKKDGGWALHLPAMTLQPGTYTFSCFARSSSNDNLCITENKNGVRNDIWFSTKAGNLLPDQFTRVSATYTYDEEVTVWYAAQGSGGSPNIDFWFCGYKLERGNVATDWSPAPEDKADVPLQFSVPLPASGWVSGAQTVKDARFLTGDQYAYLVDLAGKISAADDVTTAGQMTFRADVTPTEAVTVDIIRLEVAVNG